MGSEARASVDLVRWQWAFQQWATANTLAAAAEVAENVLRVPGAIAGGHGDGSLWSALGHMVGAEEHWTNRWLGQPRSSLRDGRSYAESGALVAEWQQNNARLQSWLSGLTAGQFAGDLHYFRSTGEEQHTPLWQTLAHVANHATHHRAEACIVLTAAGSAPRGIDMIDWVRAGCPGT